MAKGLFDDFLTATESTSHYTTKASVPQYEPSPELVSIYELCSTLKYEELINNIENSTVTEQEKEFLRLAACRHIVFNYAKIADYYASASKEMQQLMEDSALVLIDINDAIANGYVKLDAKITELASKAYQRRVELKGK